MTIYRAKLKLKVTADISADSIESAYKIAKTLRKTCLGITILPDDDLNDEGKVELYDDPQNEPPDFSWSMDLTIGEADPYNF